MVIKDQLGNVHPLPPVGAAASGARLGRRTPP